MAKAEFPGSTYKIYENRMLPANTGVRRKPDVWVRDRQTGQVVKVYEAARQEHGEFVPRELKKVDEYEAAGIPYHLEPVAPTRE